jgi:hypothetical protein
MHSYLLRWINDQHRLVRVLDEDILELNPLKPSGYYVYVPPALTYQNSAF